MRRLVLLAVLLLLASAQAQAQSDVPKLEVGAQYTLLNLRSVSGQNTSSGFFGFNSPGLQHGVGGRIVLNPTRMLSLEAELNFFPNGKYVRALNEGNATQALFGTKIGKRLEKIGIFGKVRPGLVHFSRVLDCRGEFSNSCLIDTRTEFTVDLGGVLEYYSTRHAALRVDVGDTLLRYGNFKTGSAATGGTVPFKSGITNNLQISVGFSYRF